MQTSVFQKLLTLEWKAFFRSASIGKSIAIKILLGFFGLYFFLAFLGLGIGIYFILEKEFSEAPILIVNNFLLAWFIAELIIRFILQNLPVVNIKPLLVQNIRQKTIIHYLLSKSLLSFYNIIAPIFFIPFMVVCSMESSYSILQLLGWLVAVLSTSLTIHYLNFIIQKNFSENLKGLIPFIAICLALFGLDYFKVFSVSDLFGQVFTYILQYPYLGFLFILFVVIGYRANFSYLTKHLYLDGFLSNKSQSYKETDLSWTNRFGALAPFIQLDIKLIWRNKRPKATVGLSFLFLLYGLIFYTNPTYANSSFLIFVGVFITGIFTINFGQFIPAWDSSYYSMLMTQNIPIKQYLNAKALLMYLSIAVLALLSTPYVYFGWNILFINLACAIYNMGVNVPVLLYFGSHNKKRVDLDKSQFLNYQGTGAAQWLVSIPLFIVPVLIWLLISTLFDQSTASISIAALGLIGILLKDIIMNKIVLCYRKRKHVMIEGFKQQS